MNRRSLCERCNNLTGDRYARHLGRFTHQVLAYLDQLPETYVDERMTVEIQPLEVIKQVVIMSIALGDPRSARTEIHRDLRRLVENPKHNGRIGDWRAFIYLTRTGARHCGPCGVLDKGRVIVCHGEVALMPLGYVFLDSSRDSMARAAELGLCDITGLLDYEYDRVKTMSFRLNVLEPSGWDPMTFWGHGDGFGRVDRQQAAK